jgi:hypothetical protein
MTKQIETSLQSQAEFFKALAHPARLMILNLVRVKPRHGEELALILNLNPATISHHLGLLSAAGFLTARKEQYYQVYSLVEERLAPPLAELVAPVGASPVPSADGDPFRAKVLATFFRRGKLVSIPAQMKKFQVILEKLADEFEPDRKYTEREVNQMLVEFHDDVASLRRGLIEFKLMERAGGLYWRI